MKIDDFVLTPDRESEWNMVYDDTSGKPFLTPQCDRPALFKSAL